MENTEYGGASRINNYPTQIYTGQMWFIDKIIDNILINQGNKSFKVII